MGFCRYGVVFLAAALLPAAIPEAFADSYRAALDKTCAAKHLEFLTPGSLDLQIEDFEDALPPAQKAQFDRAADKEKKAACATVTMGLSCFNGASIRALESANLGSQLARMVCKAPVVCAPPEPCNAP